MTATLAAVQRGTKRYEELKNEVLNANSGFMWVVGDALLEIAPMKDPNNLALVGSVENTARLFAAETDLDYKWTTLLVMRSTSNSFPKATRNPKISHTAHRLLAGHPDRYDLIHTIKTKDDASRLMREYRESGQATTRCGVLTTADDKIIAKKYAKGMTQTALAEEFGVAQATIGRAITRVEKTKHTGTRVAKSKRRIVVGGVEVTPSMYDAIQAECSSRNITESGFLRDLISQWMGSK